MSDPTAAAPALSRDDASDLPRRLPVVSESGPPAPSPLDARAGAARRVALLGNVCVGKTTLFDHLCANGVHAVNIPGSTLTISRAVLAVGPAAAPRAIRAECGSCGKRRRPVTACLDGASTPEPCTALAKASKAAPTPQGGRQTPVTHIYDTPGASTLRADGQDDMVARDLVLSGQVDVAVLVADAKNLRRSLALALEIAEFELPMVLDLNMLDEAEDIGLAIDDGVLSSSLGVPIARTVAVEDRGVRRLSELIVDAPVPKRRVHFPEVVETALGRLAGLLANPSLSPRGLGILLLAKDPAAEKWVADRVGEQRLREARGIVDDARRSSSRPLETVISDAFHAEARRIAERAVSRSARGASALARFGDLAQAPLAGSIIALCVLAAAYLWVGTFGSTFLVGQLERFFHDVLLPASERLAGHIPSAFVRDAIVDRDFGLLPTGLFLPVGVVLPVLFCFFAFQAALEDSGYLPRLAVLFDRSLRRLGLNGRGLVPLILGFSCIAMAVIATRTLPTRRERTILTLLVGGLPCAPLLAVMIVVLGTLSWTAAATVVGLLLLRIVVAGALASKVLPGGCSDLIMEIPQMRLPRLGMLLSKTCRRTWDFTKEAVPLFVVASLLVFVFARLGGLAALEHAARPAVRGILGLPDDAVRVFIKTAIRRETGGAELSLLRDHFTPLQMVVSLVVMTFLLPCINASFVMIKERGLKTATVLILVMITIAITAGAAVNGVCHALGITFA